MPIVRTCPYCAKDFLADRERSRFCSRPCAWKCRKRKPEVWFLAQTHGYIEGYIYRDGARVHTKQHRVIAERTIGRKLLPTEEVHHLNGDKTDNRPENLQVLDRSAHRRLHLAERDPLPKKSHCLNGHPYSGANLYVWKGKRSCRACRAARSREQNRKRWLRRRNATTQPNMDAR